MEIAQHRAQRQPGLERLRLVGAIAVRGRRVGNGPKAPSRWSVGFGPCRRAAPLRVG
jgi:hypothetical protein